MSTFGKEVDAIWPPIDVELQPISKFGQKLLEQCKTLKKPDPEARVDVELFMRRSTDFPLEVESATPQGSQSLSPTSFLYAVRCAELPRDESAGGASRGDWNADRIHLSADT